MFTCLPGVALAEPVVSKAVPSNAAIAPTRSLRLLFMLHPFFAHTGITGPCAIGLA
jgi:hypothetical protein